MLSHPLETMERREGRVESSLQASAGRSEQFDGPYLS